MSPEEKVNFVKGEMLNGKKTKTQDGIPVLQYTYRQSDAGTSWRKMEADIRR